MIKLLKLKLFVVSAILVSFSITFQSCAGLQEVKIGEIKSVIVKGMKKNIVTVELSAHVANPNNFRILLNGADISVKANEFNVGKIKRIDPLNLPANSDEVQKLTFDVELSNIIAGAMGMMSGLRNGFDLGLDGTIHVKYMIFGKTVEIKETRKVDNIGIQ